MHLKKDNNFVCHYQIIKIADNLSLLISNNNTFYKSINLSIYSKHETSLWFNRFKCMNAETWSIYWLIHHRVKIIQEDCASAKQSFFVSIAVSPHVIKTKHFFFFNLNWIDLFVNKFFMGKMRFVGIWISNK